MDADNVAFPRAESEVMPPANMLDMLPVPRSSSEVVKPSEVFMNLMMMEPLKREVSKPVPGSFCAAPEPCSGSPGVTNGAAASPQPGACCSPQVETLRTAAPKLLYTGGPSGSFAPQTTSGVASPVSPSDGFGSFVLRRPYLPEESLQRLSAPTAQVPQAVQQAPGAQWNQPLSYQTLLKHVQPFQVAQQPQSFVAQAVQPSPYSSAVQAAPQSLLSVLRLPGGSHTSAPPLTASMQLPPGTPTSPQPPVPASMQLPLSRRTVANRHWSEPISSSPASLQAAPDVSQRNHSQLPPVVRNQLPPALQTTAAQQPWQPQQCAFQNATLPLQRPEASAGSVPSLAPAPSPPVLAQASPVPVQMRTAVHTAPAAQCTSSQALPKLAAGTGPWGQTAVAQQPQPLPVQSASRPSPSLQPRLQLQAPVQPQPQPFWEPPSQQVLASAPAATPVQGQPPSQPQQQPLQLQGQVQLRQPQVQLQIPTSTSSQQPQILTPTPIAASAQGQLSTQQPQILTPTSCAASAQGQPSTQQPQILTPTTIATSAQGQPSTQQPQILTPTSCAASAQGQPSTQQPQILTPTTIATLAQGQPSTQQPQILTPTTIATSAQGQPSTQQPQILTPTTIAASALGQPSTQQPQIRTTSITALAQGHPSSQQPQWQLPLVQPQAQPQIFTPTSAAASSQWQFPAEAMVRSRPQEEYSWQLQVPSTSQWMLQNSQQVASPSIENLKQSVPSGSNPVLEAVQRAAMQFPLP
eukprot:TRINITY_DN1215_c0_g1_i3.p1 TRINITY_DN1215_c0_g1~~TRINITY_DN1215_c0_g1_i3.p1  ORF type:complete len:749 (-),score=153.04 TRINITY_DN1215_c0_g1_i3:46-2292(-)